MTVDTPTVNWGEWPIVAIVLIVVIFAALGAWVVIRWLLSWQSQEADKSRKLVAEEAERSRVAIAEEAARSRQMVMDEANRNRVWQEQQQANWQRYLSERDEHREAQNDKRDSILGAVVEALEAMQKTNNQMIQDVKTHHAIVEKIAASQQQQERVKGRGGMR